MVKISRIVAVRINNVCFFLNVKYAATEVTHLCFFRIRHFIVKRFGGIGGHGELHKRLVGVSEFKELFGNIKFKRLAICVYKP